MNEHVVAVVFSMHAWG